jgi:hypothetical protein
MADAPDVAQYGKVIGFWSITGPDSDDPGTEPDEIPLTGQITIEPLVEQVIWDTIPSQMTFVDTFKCQVYNGLIYGPDSEPEGIAPDPDGVWLLASSQPHGAPVTIQYRATFLLDRVLKQPDDIVFDVLASPAVTDLSSLIPAVPVPPIIYTTTTGNTAAAAASATAAAASATAAAGSASAAAATAAAVPKWWAGTQVAYDAIATKDPTTLYVITG